MRLDDEQADAMLEKAAAEIRNEPIDPAAIENSAGRVWARISEVAEAPEGHRIRSCSDFQALMPAYRAGDLSPERKLLLEDHTHECVACRKAMDGRPQPAPLPVMRREAGPAFRWAIAAGVVVTVGLSCWMLLDRLLSSPRGSRVLVQSAKGMLYRVSDQQLHPIREGEQVTTGEEIRTAKDSLASLRLRDGSIVEMHERSGISIIEAGRSLTIHLARGAVIVQAARRYAGRLYLATKDCRVSVTGTVFTVNSAVKGSRVSVLEGEVQIAHAGQKKVLRPGEQFSSDRSLAAVPIEQEISWSGNLEAHLALLRALSDLQKRLEEVRFPELRYSSALLARLPKHTAVFLSIPNLGTALSEAQQVIRQGIAQNPALTQWWDQGMGPRLAEGIETIRALSDYLGPEIIAAGSSDNPGDWGKPVFVAELKRSGFREFVQAELIKRHEKSRLRLVDNPAALAAGARGDLLMLIRPDVVAISTDTSALRLMAAALDGGPAGGFAGTPFGARIGEAYRGGAGLVFGADLEKIAAGIPSHHQGLPGWREVKYLMVEQRPTAGKTETRALLSFRGPRQGVASWLGPPAPFGALDFISPEAAFVCAFAVKNPAAILDEIFTYVQAGRDDFRGDQAALEARMGINLRADLALPLGAEFAVALDGPLLPAPSWKLVVEVYDPARLLATIQKLLETYNREALRVGRPVVPLAQITAGGRNYYSLTIPEPTRIGEVHYAFVNGYLVAASSRALLDRAIQNRSTGLTLARSADFVSLLPHDHYPNFSGLAYMNLGPTLGPLLEALNSTSGAGVLPSQAPPGLSSDSKPFLVALYGEQDRITLASSGGPLGLTVANLGLTLLLGGGRRGTP